MVLSAPVLALELDISVDEEIRKHYNPSKLENDLLPALPKVAPSSPKQNTTLPAVPKTSPSSNSPSVPKTAPVTPPTKPQLGVKKLPNSYNPRTDKSTAIRLKKGTKFRVKSNSVISDYQKEGTRVTFTSLKPVTQRYVTIPQGTKFTAVVKDSHLPQYSGNGGLIVLLVESMSYKGAQRSVHAKITKANLKKVFFNNIKGKRGYWKGVGKQIDKGESFYKKTRRTSNKLADNPIGVIVSPIPTITGMLVYAVNFAGSPLFAIWSKGSRISIPAGSEFEIKLLEDVYLE